ncbi:HBL/NHE enterotoxin family protein [Streptomyces roseoverticillatus]|uniref:HBL/NHE enterotoxin family protein n=1 Tax=Streptomyces roseoverticillatus TaxID=66429 RepID=UPI001F262E73|nr:HBL/NHE enterotoxin family protein [Streptomyces roseoverticillatus]MCF3106962.1 HBL/NHE enterotoxin family protein [Streptomyces roseoverticillatus]
MTATTSLLSSVGRAATDILDNSPEATEAAPELAGHVEKARGHARTWLESTSHGLEEPLRASRAFIAQYTGTTAPRLADLAASVKSGGTEAQPAKAELLRLLQAAKASLADLQNDLTRGHDAVNSLGEGLAADVSDFNGDMAGISAKIASDEQLQRQLGRDIGEQMAKLKALQEALTHLTVMASGTDFGSLMSQGFQLAAEECYLKALVKRLGVLVGSVTATEDALVAFGNGLSGTQGILDDVLESVTRATATSSFLTARLNVVLNNFRDLGTQLDRLLGTAAEGARA